MTQRILFISLTAAGLMLLLCGDAFAADEAERLQRAMTKYGSTRIEPLAMILTLLMGVAVIVLPRRLAVVPLVLTAVFIPVAQRVVVVSLDFNMVRILLLFALGRVIGRGELSRIRINTMDKLILALIGVSAAAYTILNASFGAFVNRAGNAFDILGVYFFSRSVIRTPADLLTVARAFQFSAVGMACFMAIEFSTGRNLFHIFGGVPEFTPMRDGRFRCQGAFNHPILAGTFGATTFPLAIGEFLSAKHAKRSRLLPMIGMAGALGACVFSVSSGPLIALISGTFGWLFWPLRKQMRIIRWSIAAALVVLEIVTKHPIWHLVVYLRVTESSTAYQRYRLIQAAVDHVGEWWLLGTRSTLHWGHFMHDITNQYILWAVRGGLLSLIIFVALISFAFAHVGRAMKWVGRSRKMPPKQRKAWTLFLFGFGCSLLSHATVFLSVSYYGQMLVLWTLFVSLLGGLPQVFGARAKVRRKRVKQPVAAPQEASQVPVGS